VRPARRRWAQFFFFSFFWDDRLFLRRKPPASGGTVDLFDNRAVWHASGPEAEPPPRLILTGARRPEGEKADPKG